MDIPREDITRPGWPYGMTGKPTLDCRRTSSRVRHRSPAFMTSPLVMACRDVPVFCRTMRPMSEMPARCTLSRERRPCSCHGARVTFHISLYRPGKWSTRTGTWGGVSRLSLWLVVTIWVRPMRVEIKRHCGFQACLHGCRAAKSESRMCMPRCGGSCCNYVVEKPQNFDLYAKAVLTFVSNPRRNVQRLAIRQGLRRSDRHSERMML